MDKNDIDKDLKSLYGGIRAADSRKAPSFERLMARPAAGTMSFAPMLRIAAAVAISVCAGTMALQMCQKTAVQEIQQEKWANISGWEASTDNLLTMSTSNFDGSLATGTDVWLEYSGTNSKGSL